jgi:hypothetical protein
MICNFHDSSKLCLIKFFFLRREINQYHIEKAGRRVVKDPNWSLGKYKKTMIVRERPSSTNKQEKTIITKVSFPPSKFNKNYTL